MLAAVVLLLLVACVPGTPGPGGGGDGSPPAAQEPATMPTEIPSWLLECGNDKDSDDALKLADLDLTLARWSTPSGFEVVTSYFEENPVETLLSSWYAEPTDPPMPTLNVANVIIYTGVDWGDLADECGRVPLEAVEEKLAQYREQIGAQPLSDARMTEVAGQPAIQQEVGLSEYSYTGYWLFSQTQLLHAYCQWTEPGYRSVLENGCDALVASITIG